MIKGTVIIQSERCKGCQLCIFACPQGVLRLSNAYNSRGYRTVRLDETDRRCTGCAVCAVICPDSVFTVYRETSHSPAMGADAKGGCNGQSAVERQ
ncbi:MAG: 2-oxoacid:acceptor oxidoreductase [Chloroflexi bacterium]|nr:MAG: 2-oxoacid:acceptor oxidoreductase [Chloroflexota bacterium]